MRNRNRDVNNHFRKHGRNNSARKTELGREAQPESQRGRNVNFVCAGERPSRLKDRKGSENVVLLSQTCCVLNGIT